MFLPENMHKSCEQYYNFYCKQYFWKQPFKSFPNNRCLYLVYLWNSRGGLISSKVAGCRSAVFVEVGYFLDISRTFCLFCYLFCNRLFLWRFSQWLLQYFKDTFHFNLTWKESFLESTLAGGFLINMWYCIKYLKHQLCIGNLERFP